MERVLYIGAVFVSLVSFASADSTVCEGKWKLNKVEECEEPDKYPLKLDIRKRKINRTHDGFSMTAKLLEDFTADYETRLEMYEKCDGGYKLSYMMSDFTCDMLNKYCKENFQELLTQAGATTQDCPIPKGEWGIKDFMINYETLPKQAKCGEFKWISYLMKNKQEVSCITTYGTFSEIEEDEEY